MPKPILMPQVGQDLTEGKLVEWRVKVGDRVSKGDIVAVVESEKASFEVEAFEAGTVLDLLYEEGATTEVLAPLLFVGEPDEAEASPPAQAAPAPAEAPTQAQVAAPAAPESVPAPSSRPGKTRSSPLARRLAARHGLDLAALSGTGPGGAVIRRDVETAARAAAPATAAPAVAAPAAAGTLHRVWLRKGDGPPVVMIHGFGADLNAWRGLVAAAALPVPVLALDLPGHGGSAAHAATSLDAMAAAVAATLIAEGIEAADLVGHSLGAAVAGAVARDPRLAVRSLFLIAPAGLGPDIDGAFLDGFLRARSEASLAPWMRHLVSDAGVMGPAFVRVTAETRSLPGVAEGQARVSAALFPDGTQGFSVRDDLARLPGPVRIVFGEADRIVPARHARGLPGTVALHLFPGLGHMPHLEARDSVARLLAEHLRAVAR